MATNYEDEDESGIPKLKKPLDPETQAISQEFDRSNPANSPMANAVWDEGSGVEPQRGVDGAPQMAARTHDMQDDNQNGRDDRDETGIPGGDKAPSTTVPGVGQEEATTRVGATRQNYDVVEGGEGITWGDTSRLSGFNTNEWGEGGTEGYHDTSVKNTFGKIASRYDPSPDGARTLVNDPDFKRMFPQAVLIDHPTDPKIQFFPEDEPVDVLISSGQGGWGWQPEGGGGGGGAAGGGAGSVTGADLQGLDISALTDPDVLAKIQAALQSMGRGEQPMIDEAIQQEFL